MSADVDLHTPEAHDVIACELTACILGQRWHDDRLDLRVDVAGQMHRIGRQLARMQLELSQRIADAIRPGLDNLARSMARLEQRGMR